MTQALLTFTGDWEEYSRFLGSARFSMNVEREIRRATIKNSLYLVREIRQEIRARNFEPNKPLTLALAKGTIPLLKSKNLWDAIEYKLHSSFTAEIGIIRNTRSTGGVTGKTIDMYKLVELMHTGYVIKVTPRMIAAIMAALNSQRTKRGRLTARARQMIKQIETERKEKLPSRGGIGSKRGVWRVKARPYMLTALIDTEVEKMVRQNYREALERAFKNQGAKGGDYRDR